MSRSPRLRAEHKARQLVERNLQTLAVYLQREDLGMQGLDRGIVMLTLANLEAIIETTGGNEYTAAYRVELEQLKQRVAHRDAGLQERARARCLRLVN